MNRPHEIGHIGGGAAGERGISLAQPRRTQRALRYGIRITHLDGKSRGEPSDALKLPASRQPLGQAAEGLIKGKLPDVADDEIMVDVGGGQASAQILGLRSSPDRQIQMNYPDPWLTCRLPGA